MQPCLSDTKGNAFLSKITTYEAFLYVLLLLLYHIIVLGDMYRELNFHFYCKKKLNVRDDSICRSETLTKPVKCGNFY